MRWPFKDPDETIDYSVDWSRYLGDRTISSVDWYVYDAAGVKTLIDNTDTVYGLTSGSQSNTTTVASVRWSAGTAGITYKIVCAMTDSSGQITERVIQLPVRNR